MDNEVLISLYRGAPWDKAKKLTYAYLEICISLLDSLKGKKVRLFFQKIIWLLCNKKCFKAPMPPLVVN